MGNPMYISPLDEIATWQIEPHQLAEALQADWPEVDVFFPTSSDNSMTVYWALYTEQNYCYECSIDNDYQTVSFDTYNLEAIAPMVVWYRNRVVPAHVRLRLFDSSGYFSLEIPSQVTLEELLNLAKHGPKYEVPSELINPTDLQIRRLIKGLKEERGYQRGLSEYILTQLGSRLIPFIWEILENEDSEEIFYSLLDVISRLGEAGIALLEQTSTKGNMKIRYASVSAFWDNPQPAAARLLANALSDEDEAVRNAAATSLIELKKDALPILNILLDHLNEPNEATKAQIISALANTAAPQAFEPLLSILADSNESIYVRQEAAIALARTGGRKALDSLFTALDRADEELGNSIVSAIEMVYDKRELERLSTFLQRGKFNYHITRLLIQLGEISIKPLMGVFATQPDERYSVVNALGRIGKPAIGVLLGLVQPDQEAKTRLYAMYGLIEINEPELIAPLIALAKDPDDEIRQWAVSALGKFQQPQIKEALLEALSDESVEVQSWALRALEKNRHEDIFELALKYAKDENPEMRAVAYHILGRSGRQEALAILEQAKIIEDKSNYNLYHAAVSASQQLRARLKYHPNVPTFPY